LNSEKIVDSTECMAGEGEYTRPEPLSRANPDPTKQGNDHDRTAEDS
jgi:hypothetical protein